MLWLTNKNICGKAWVLGLGICIGIHMLLLAGCSATKDNGTTYLSHRVGDVSDIVDVTFLAGKAGRVDIKYGIGMWGIGMGEAKGLSVGQRQTGAVRMNWVEMAPLPFPTGVPMAIFVLPGLFGDESSYEIIQGTTGMLVGYEQEQSGRLKLAEEDHYEHDIVRQICVATEDGVNWGKSFPIGLELTFYLGARARVFPVEVVDLVLGITGFDFLHDDQ